MGNLLVVISFLQMAPSLASVSCVLMIESRKKNLLSVVGVLEDVVAVFHIMAVHVVVVALMCLAASIDGASEGSGSKKGSCKEGNCETHIEDVAGLMEESC